MQHYMDIDLRFRPHPMTGDITWLADADAVKRSIVTIGTMLPYDIPFEPDLHGHVRNLLFEIPSPVVEAALKSRIEWAISKMEPRAEILDVSVKGNSEETGYDIRVRFSVVSLVHDQEIQFFIERLR